MNIEKEFSILLSLLQSSNNQERQLAEINYENLLNNDPITLFYLHLNFIENNKEPILSMILLRQMFERGNIFNLLFNQKEEEQEVQEILIIKNRIIELLFKLPNEYLRNRIADIIATSNMYEIWEGIFEIILSNIGTEYGNTMIYLLTIIIYLNYELLTVRIIEVEIIEIVIKSLILHPDLPSIYLFSSIAIHSDDEKINKELIKCIKPIEKIIKENLNNDFIADVIFQLCEVAEFNGLIFKNEELPILMFEISAGKFSNLIRISSLEFIVLLTTNAPGMILEIFPEFLNDLLQISIGMMSEFNINDKILETSNELIDSGYAAIDRISVVIPEIINKVLPIYRYLIDLNQDKELIIAFKLAEAIAEGSKELFYEYLDEILNNFIFKGILNCRSLKVKWTSCDSIGTLSELFPGINHPEIIPSLISLFEIPELLFKALETFSHYADNAPIESINLYYKQLLPILCSILINSKDIYIIEWTLTSISSVIKSMKSELIPYFEEIFNLLINTLNSFNNDMIQAKSIEAISFACCSIEPLNILEPYLPKVIDILSISNWELNQLPFIFNSYARLVRHLLNDFLYILPSIWEDIKSIAMMEIQVFEDIDNEYQKKKMNSVFGPNNEIVYVLTKEISSKEEAWYLIFTLTDTFKENFPFIEETLNLSLETIQFPFDIDIQKWASHTLGNLGYSSELIYKGSIGILSQIHIETNRKLLVVLIENLFNLIDSPLLNLNSIEIIIPEISKILISSLIQLEIHKIPLNTSDLFLENDKRIKKINSIENEIMYHTTNLLYPIWEYGNIEFFKPFFESNILPIYSKLSKFDNDNSIQWSIMCFDSAKRVNIDYSMIFGDLIFKGLNSQNIDLLISSIDALGSIGLIEQINPFLNSNNENIRDAALFAIFRINFNQGKINENILNQFPKRKDSISFLIKNKFNDLLLPYKRQIDLIEIENKRI